MRNLIIVIGGLVLIWWLLVNAVPGWIDRVAYNRCMARDDAGRFQRTDLWYDDKCRQWRLEAGRGG